MSSKLERARQSMSRLRERLKSQEPLRGLSAFGGGAAVGTLERRGTLPVTVLGLPTKPVVATVGYIVAANSSPGRKMHSVFAGAADGIAGAYGYAAAKAGTLIAGDEYDDADEYDEEEAEEEEVAV